MKAEIKKKWLKALRSGKYKQTAGNLYDPAVKAHCCLGVLRHVVTGENKNNTARNTNTLGVRFLKAVGLSDDAQMDLVRRNDGGLGYDQHNFEQIADVIERTL